MIGLLKQKTLGLLLLYAVLLASFSSCVTSKKILYFQDIKDSVTTTKVYTIDSVTKFVSPVILPNDILMITVQTVAQAETSNPLSQAKTTLFDPITGFLVDINGNVELALIGFVKVAGLTTAEARELIKEKAKEFYKDPVVNVRIGNFQVFLLGETVLHGPIPVISERMNILEALASAGDLPLTAKRHNVLLIRTEGETKKLVRFDMTKSDYFHSPYFYMKQNDIIYVEPSKYRIQASDNRVSRNLGIISGLISLAGILLAFKSIK